jgi:hypothetical protein
MKDILEKHPKTTELIREYYKKLMIEHLKDKEFKDLINEKIITNDYLSVMIEANPFGLVYFFDENNLNLFIHYMTEKEQTKFFYTMKDIDVNPVKLLDTRKEAERDAIIEAFKMLEEKL